jgi:hypothetical protein
MVGVLESCSVDAQSLRKEEREMEVSCDSSK